MQHFSDYDSNSLILLDEYGSDINIYILCILNFVIFIFRAKNYILKAVQGDVSFLPMDFTKLSRNYKTEVPLVGSVESNVIFGSANYMPREVMLATTLDNFSPEILEVIYNFIKKTYFMHQFSIVVFVYCYMYRL